MAAKQTEKPYLHFRSFDGGSSCTLASSRHEARTNGQTHHRGGKFIYSIRAGTHASARSGANGEG